MNNIEETVIAIITKELRMKPGVVTLTSDFKKDLGVDSLDALEIVVALEDHFKLELPTSTHENINIVQDAIQAVLQHIKG